jgi:hypothetical protein
LRNCVASRVVYRLLIASLNPTILSYLISVLRDAGVLNCGLADAGPYMAPRTPPLAKRLAGPWEGG